MTTMTKSEKPEEKKPTTGMLWDRIRASLDQQEWQYNDGQWERQVFIGTVFSLYPSGKYYMPWACSNVDPCPNCRGRGFILGKHQTPRRMKKWQRDKEGCHLKFQRHATIYIGHPERIDKCRHFRRLQRLTKTVECTKCGGLGSEEAFQDQEFGEMLEAEAGERDLFVTSGEGDPCDLFVGECQDETPEGYEAEDDEEEEDNEDAAASC